MSSFDAGALLFRLQTTGRQVFRQDMVDTERDIQRVGVTAQSTATAVSRTGEATTRAGGAARDARGRFIAQGDATRQLGDEAERAAPRVRTLGQRISDTEKDMNTVGKTMLGVGAAFAAGTALSVAAARDWETAWAGVTKTVDGTPEQMQEIEDGLRGLAKELPSSHEEIAAVAEAAGQLGVKSADVVAFTKTMIDLGETTNLSADQAATSLAQFMNIMGTAGADVGRLGATIVALGNDGASTEAEIVSMAQRIAGSGALVGATEGEVLALANALASMGVTAELGGGVASRILQDLYSAVETGGDKLDGFAKVAGVSAKDFATAFQNDPIRAMGAFASGLNGVEASGGNVVQVLTDLGFKSTEEQRVLLQLKSSGDLLTDSLELQSSAWRESNALTNEAAKRYATVDSKMKAAGNSIVDAAIDFGQVFLPLISTGTDIISDIADGFGNLPEPVQAVVSVVGALAGIVGLASGAFLLALPQIIAYRASLRVLATAEIPLVSRAANGMMVATTRASRALGATATFLKGPWGIAFIAAAAAVVALGAAMNDGQPTAAGLENALTQAASGADLLREASKRGDAETTIWGDYYDELKNLGDLLDKVSAEDTTDFFNLTPKQRGAADSLKQLGEALGTLATTDLPQAQKQFRRLAEEYDLSAAQQGKLLDSMPAYKEAIEKQATAQKVNLAGMSEEQRLSKLLEIAKGDGTKAAQSAKDAYLEEAAAAAELQKQLTELLDKLMESNDANSGAISANIAYQDALRGIDEQIKNIAEGAEGYASGLDLATDAGSRNVEALQELAETSQEAAKAQFDLDGNTDGYRATLEAGRQAVIDRAMALGATAEEAQTLADKIYAIPSEASFTMIADTADAQAKLEEINSIIQEAARSIAALPIFGGADPSAGDAGSKRPSNIPMADGGLVEFFAAGGVRSENHVAQIARAGDYRVWAEPETGGELYAPLAGAKRGRSLSLIGQVLDGWGYDVVPRGASSFAGGGVVGGSSSSYSPTINYSPTIIAGGHQDENAIAEKAAAKVNDRLRKAGPS